MIARLSDDCAARTRHRHKTSGRPRGCSNRVRLISNASSSRKDLNLRGKSAGWSHSRRIHFILDSEINARIGLPGDQESAMIVRYPG
jgi:hypothetical protein